MGREGLEKRREEKRERERDRERRQAEKKLLAAGVDDLHLQ